MLFFFQFCVVELWVVRPFHCQRGSGGNQLKQRQTDYFKIIFHTIFLFILGIAVCFLITEVGKRKLNSSKFNRFFFTLLFV